MKRYMIIYGDGEILDASEYNEGVGIYMPPGRGVIIDTKTKIKTMLGGIGITDFQKLEII